MAKKRKVGEPKLLLTLAPKGQDFDGDGIFLIGDDTETFSILARALDLYIDFPGLDKTKEAQARKFHAMKLKKQLNEFSKVRYIAFSEFYRHMVMGTTVRSSSLEETMRDTNKKHKEIQNAD